MTARRALALAVFSLALAAPAFAAGPVAVSGAAAPFHVGALELVALRDAKFEIPNDAKIFGVEAGPAAVSAVLAKAGAPTDQIALGVDALLVMAPGHIVLIDTGLGAKAHGALLDSLALARVKPESVTDILITHSHGDHVGGLFTADGAPAFPAATVRMSAKEWAAFQAQAPGRAKAIAAQVKTFAPGETVVPGITAVAIAGHTPGHVGYEIVSGHDRLLDIGDTAHSSIVSLAQPDWVMGFDGDKETARKSRRAELAALAKSHELVFAPHFPFPGVGRVEAQGDGFVWKPELKPQP